MYTINSSDEEDDLNDDINKAISEIDHYNPKPISLDKDVMMYWEEKKFVYPHLYELARIVHSVPATQLIPRCAVCVPQSKLNT
ncbi:hypothetical protein FF38_05660 [Lucilia cuprina]|uniref:HAT C-terminal dimerisation domain-containing protein n=1 Tax=Lucilia cuprina TaxID=7375 RepID=A0A0L0BY26_LUCCU|nr:hypothetical protein FF38_05660 [Lucilia cuprina]